MPDLSEYRFTKTHEWVRMDGTDAMVGITDNAQSQLGDVIFLDVVAEVRGTLEHFDVALAVHPRVDIDHVARLGATWAMHSFWPGHRIDQIHRFIERGVPS